MHSRFHILIERGLKLPAALSRTYALASGVAAICAYSELSALFCVPHDPVSITACLANELVRLLDCSPTVAAGRKSRDAIDLEARDKLFVFLTRRDIEPANNASERALRMPVIFRK